MTAQEWADRFQAAFDKIKNAPYQPPVHYVSGTRYIAAMNAAEAGASQREVWLIAMGASPEVAKQMAEGA